MLRNRNIRGNNMPLIKSVVQKPCNMASCCVWKPAREILILVLLGVVVAVMAMDVVHSESLVQKLNDEEPDVHEAGNAISWGLQDATATPERLFEYHLPKSPFGDKVTQYKVSEAGSPHLPKWLHFDAVQNILEGVPSTVDNGRLLYIEVTANNRLNNELTTSKDIFVIRITQEAAIGGGGKPLRDLHDNGSSPITCSPNSAVTKATVIVDANFDAMSGQARARTLRDLARHLDLPVNSLRMQVPGVAKQQLDTTALVAGPGNVVKPRHSEDALVQWIVGCGSVTDKHMKILQNLELAARDGSLSHAIGNGIVGWHVTNSRMTGPMRKKRLVPHPTVTTQPTLRPPVGQSTATMVIIPSDGPETRIIPSFASPTVSDVPEKPHRSKTKVRHQNKTKHIKHTTSATKISDNLQSKASFEDSISFHPTPVLPVLPTHSDVNENVIIPLTTRLPDTLEPSLVFPVASLATTPTRVLSTSTHVSFVANFTTASQLPIVKMPDFEIVEGIMSALPSTVQTPPDNLNYAPILKNDIDKLSVSVGQVFMYTIPNDTFLDYEDGPTRNLTLVFQTVDGLSMAPNSWIKFNETTQTLYGMPLQEHAGRQDYILAARDSDGKLTRDSFEIVIQQRFLERKVNHEITVSLDVDFQIFSMDVDQRVAVANKIAQAQGDVNASKMAITKIREGSVEFSWTNVTLAGLEECPTESLLRLTENMIQADGTLSLEFLQALHPFVVLYVEFTPKGSCVSRTPFRSGGRPQDTMTTILAESESESKPKIAKSIDGLIMTTIVPILILVVILAFALALVCAVCTRRKKADGCDANHTTRKGVPVIFADELEEKPTMPTKPLILTDEKPPVAPPDYDQATASNSPSTPRSCCNDPLIPGNENGGGALQRSSQPSNQPYLPTYNTHTGNTGSKRNTRLQLQQQASRNPPPYVSS